MQVGPTFSLGEQHFQEKIVRPDQYSGNFVPPDQNFRDRYLAAASVFLGLPTQFAHCCLAATRAFMPASLIVIPYTILEISKFLG